MASYTPIFTALWKPAHLCGAKDVYRMIWYNERDIALKEPMAIGPKPKHLTTKQKRTLHIPLRSLHVLNHVRQARHL